MRFGSWYNFAVQYNVDFNVGGGRNGLVGSFTYWISSVQYGMTGMEVANFGTELEILESKLASLEDSRLNELAHFEPRSLLAAYIECYLDLEPVYNASYSDEYREIPRETWRLARLAPGNSEAFDDGSFVLMVVTDEVRVFGAKTIATPKGVRLCDFSSAVVEIGPFRHALSSAIQWADACPTTTEDD